MGFRFECDDTRHRVVLTADGAITADAWADAAAQILLGRVWHYVTLYDFTAAGASVPSAADLTAIEPALRELTEQEGARGAVAFAIPNEEDHQRIREWVATAGRRVLRLIEVFHTRAEAERWLDALSVVPPVRRR
jgi:hypothetical protein